MTVVLCIYATENDVLRCQEVAAISLQSVALSIWPRSLRQAAAGEVLVSHESAAQAAALTTGLPTRTLASRASHIYSKLLS